MAEGDGCAISSKWHSRAKSRKEGFEIRKGDERFCVEITVFACEENKAEKRAVLQ